MSKHRKARRVVDRNSRVIRLIVSGRSREPSRHAGDGRLSRVIVGSWGQKLRFRSPPRPTLHEIGGWPACRLECSVGQELRESARRACGVSPSCARISSAPDPVSAPFTPRGAKSRVPPCGPSPLRFQRSPRPTPGGQLRVICTNPLGAPTLWREFAPVRSSPGRSS